MYTILPIKNFFCTTPLSKFRWLTLALILVGFMGAVAQNITTCGSTGGVNMVGSMQGYSQPINCAANYRVLTYRKVSTTVVNPTDGRGQWKTTSNVQASGGDYAPSNMSGGGGGGGGFLLTNGDVCGNTGQYTRKWVFPSAYQATLNAINAVNYYTSGGSDMGVNMGTAGRYTVVLQDVGCANSSYYIGYTANAPVTLSFGAQTLNGDGSYTIPITTSAAPSAGELIYIRYRLTTNDFTTSTILVQATGAGTAWSATIPSVPTGTTVYYYAFTSTRTLASLNADSESNRSLSTLNFLDNSGNNYSYLQSITIGPILVTGTTPVSSAFYNSLTLAGGAFAAINAGTHRGVVTVTIMSNVTTETGANALFQSGYLGTSSYTSISLVPSGARVISGSSTTQLIDLNGCDFVSINGINSGGNSLTIENTASNASNGTIRFVNDARNNTINNCTLRGSSNQANAAVVYFSSADGTLLQGNDNNVISNNIIRESISGDPIFGINSFGSSGAIARWNSNNSVIGNQIVNVYSPATALCAAIQLTNGANTVWNISNNSIYWTNNKSSTAATADYFYGIRITGGNGANFTISGNFIGGTAVNCGGTPMTISNNTFGNKISAIDINTSTVGIASSIQGNTIANIALATNSNKSTAPFIFSGIIVSGLVNIGNLTANTIGSNLIAGSISVTTSATGAGGTVCGIGVQGASSNCNIANNVVSGISLLNGTGTRTMSFYGIIIFAGTAVVTGNTVGSGTLANSIINSTGNASADVTYIVGISHAPSASVSSISNNLLANINYNATGSNVILWGISSSSAGPALISGNTIRNFTYSCVGTLYDGLVGIYTNGNEIITQNSVYSLVNTSAISDSYIAGILAYGGGTPTITRNLVYGIVNNNKVTNYTFGILVSATNGEISNNMVSLGSAVTNACSFRGISIENIGNYNVFFNSVVITGSSSGTNADSYAFTTSFGTVNSRNNILYNDRLPANLGSKCLSYSGALNSDYNNFYCAAGSAIANTYTTLAAYQGGTSLDLNSRNVLPTFTNLASDLHLASGNCSLYGVGTTIAVTIDYDNETRKNPPDLGADENTGSGGLTWTGLTSTDWNVASNWCPPIVPLSTSNVTIPSAPINQPLISNANAVCKDVTINAGAAHLDMGSSRTLTLSATAVFTNNGTFNCGAANEELIFAGSGTIAGSASTTFRNLTINSTTTLLTIPTISANLKLNSTANVTAAPNYGASSTLIYNNTGSYNVVTEWTGTAVTAGTGVPNNVIIQNGTTLNMPTTLRGMAGDLTISSGTLQMNGTSGADLNIGGNWTRVAATGVFNPNSRAVSFKGAANQTVTVVGGGIERFNILVIDKPNAGTYLMPSAVAGNLTDITVNGNMASNVAVLQFINLGSLDLNGRTFRVDGNNASSYPGHIYVNGPRVVYNSAGINNGSFAIMSSTNPNQPNWFTRSVWNNFGTGTLTFNQDVLVTIADGRLDWGLDALGVNVTTIQGVLQINLGGSIVYNSCYYSSTPPSTLRFANTIDYQVNAGDKTWAFGAIYSGLPGIPYNVEINNTNTDLTINEVRALRNNLTITDGRLTINSGPFNIGGNWTRTNPAGITTPPCAFIPNSNRVVFDKTGAGDQFITCTANGNVETFYDLDISPATANVALGGATQVVVTNNLILTSGKVDLNTNRLTLGTTSAAGTLTGGSATSYILAYKAAMNGTFRRYTPATSFSYLFPVGDNSNYTPMTILYNPGTSLVNAFTDAQLYAVAHPQKGTATSYITRYWPVNPSGVSNTDYNATYTYADADVIGIESTLFPFKYNPYGWVGSGGSAATFMQGAGSVNVGSNTLTWTNIESFSEFTGIGNGTPLPIELLSFSAALQQQDVFLKWITASEKNNDYFTLERSWNGLDFETINQQKGAGNSSFNLSYFYTDVAVAESGNSKAYYRLKQTDFNGQFSFSKTVVVNFNKDNNISAIQAYPNPFSSDISINFLSKHDGSGLIELFSVVGKQISKKDVIIFEALNGFQLTELNNLPSGIYLLRLIFEDEIYNLKIAKE